MSFLNVQTYAVSPLKEIEIDLPEVTMSSFAHGFTWFIFAAMILSGLGFLIAAAMRPVGTRVFHQMSALLCLTAGVAYFCMASGLGQVQVAQEVIHRSMGTAVRSRAVWYARYIDWTITTPLLLVDLLLATGLPLSDIVTVIFIDVLMIVTGLIGSLTTGYAKWGLYAMGCVAQIYIWWILLLVARPSAARLGETFSHVYTTSAVMLSLLWFFYPVVWALAEGSNRISPSAEVIVFGILDALAKPVFCAVHCWGLRQCDLSRLELSSGKYSEGATAVAPLADQ